ncbi:MAG: C40 family peptidase [Acidibacillus sp.]|nr:C40 family peptidase [Acidibacillus sp.]
MQLTTKKTLTTLIGSGILMSTIAFPFMSSFPLAFASTMATESSSQAVVVHAAYLKTSPHLGTYNEIQLVQVGTNLQVLSATRYWLHVQLPDGTIGYITADHYYVSQFSTSSIPSSNGGQSQTHSVTSTATVTQSVPVNSSSTQQASGYTQHNDSSGSILPPGVTIDPNIQPLVPLTASYAAKLQAVEQIATSKLGTPYIWGHNEDRGQYGFDCSNFVQYVFHEALGYDFSSSSKVQFERIGWNIPISQMQPGDELFFSDTTNPSGSAHVGIYIGHGEMIEEGGGLGKVGYLSIDHGFWSHHLVAVHQMF